MAVMRTICKPHRPQSKDLFMTQTATQNRRCVLAERPVGEPTQNTLRRETVALPSVGAGEMRLRVQYLSFDPYMRGRMSNTPSFAPPVALGDVMLGGPVAQVVESCLAGYAARISAKL